MDQEGKGDRIESTNKNLTQAGEGVNENSKYSVNGIVSKTFVSKSEENACLGGENVDLRLQNDGFGSLRNQKMNNGGGISQPLNRNDPGSSGNSSSLADGTVLESEERGLGDKNIREVSSEVSAERRDEAINQETSEMRVVGQVDQGSNASLHNSVDGFVDETVIVINTFPDEIDRVLEVKDNGLCSSKVLTEKPKAKVAEAKEHSCVIDIKGGVGVGGGRRCKESWDGDRVCRICHLNTEQSLESSDDSSTTTKTVDLIQLGCGCKDELGIAHSHCAEAWFKLKGNRMCEICGQIAKNITGVRDNRFIEDWHDQGSSSGGGGALEQRGGCWRGQPFCNFLMACLVIAFVLPWFFRVNMF